MKILRFFTFNSKLSLAKLILIVFVFLATILVVPRFFVFQQLCARGLGCATLYRAPAGPFHRNFLFKKEGVCGDLSTMTALPQLCSPRSDVFQTDDWGYRNDEKTFNRDNDIVIFGDSFAFGAAQTQSEDAAVQIERATSRSVFNGAGKIELNFLRWQLEHFRKPPKVLVYFHLERHRLGPNEIKEWDKKIQEGAFGELAAFWETFNRYDPVKILAGRFEKNWFIPEVFPNRFANLAPRYDLKNGTPFLFLQSSVDHYGEARKDDLQVEGEFFSKLNSHLIEKKINLIVVLLPEKFNVYAPLLLNSPKPLEKTPSYLDHLEVELKRRGLSCLNMLPVFKSEAARALQKNEYIYLPDDSHWNAQGVKIMSDELKKNLTYF